MIILNDPSRDLNLVIPISGFIILNVYLYKYNKTPKSKEHLLHLCQPTKIIMPM